MPVQGGGGRCKCIHPTTTKELQGFHKKEREKYRELKTFKYLCCVFSLFHLVYQIIGTNYPMIIIKDPQQSTIKKTISHK